VYFLISFITFLKTFPEVTKISENGEILLDKCNCQNEFPGSKILKWSFFNFWNDFKRVHAIRSSTWRNFQMKTKCGYYKNNDFYGLNNDLSFHYWLAKWLGSYKHMAAKQKFTRLWLSEKCLLLLFEPIN